MAKTMNGRNGGTLIRLEKGESGNPNGRRPGIRNRSTIAKQVLAMRVTPPEKVVQRLKELYPEMADRFFAEDIATMQQMMKAMAGDTRAYQVLMEMAYEPHSQKIEQTNNNTLDIETLSDSDLKSLAKIKKKITKNNE